MYSENEDSSGMIKRWYLLLTTKAQTNIIIR
jgi:hypothetical protein